MEFKDRIRAMNEMYGLTVSYSPICLDAPLWRLGRFSKILKEEFEELVEVVDMVEAGAEPTDVLVALADLLGDIIVYCRSEAMKWGIPLEEVLDIIMDSNESKLDENGQPIINEHGKFMKGPNYWKPEPKIKELLLERGVP